VSKRIGTCDFCGADEVPLKLAAEENARLKAEVARLREALDRDRTGLAAALNAVIKEVKCRGWLLDARGPYEWDDDRYKDEAGLAMRTARDIAEKALAASGSLANAALSSSGTEEWLESVKAEVRAKALEEAARWMEDTRARKQPYDYGIWCRAVASELRSLAAKARTT
jgi:hypothetical protein